MPSHDWFVWALLSAVFAALTAVFAKVGLEGIDSDFATLVRTAVRPGRFGLWAWEVTARYSELHLNPGVFTAGLADPNLWSNDAKLVDVGVNWYLNKFVKIYFDWEHALFGSPVFSNSGSFQTSNDLFWIRTQVYF